MSGQNIEDRREKLLAFSRRVTLFKKSFEGVISLNDNYIHIRETLFVELFGDFKSAWRRARNSPYQEIGVEIGGVYIISLASRRDWERLGVDVMSIELAKDNIRGHP